MNVKKCKNPTKNVSHFFWKNPASEDDGSVKDGSVAVFIFLKVDTKISLNL